MLGQHLAPWGRAFNEIFSDITDRTMILRQYNSIDGGPAQLFGTTLFTRK
jgi:hypothetical protein